MSGAPGAPQPTTSHSDNSFTGSDMSTSSPVDTHQVASKHSYSAHPPCLRTFAPQNAQLHANMEPCKDASFVDHHNEINKGFHQNILPPPPVRTTPSPPGGRTSQSPPLPPPPPSADRPGTLTGNGSNPGFYNSNNDIRTSPHTQGSPTTYGYISPNRISPTRNSPNKTSPSRTSPGRTSPYSPGRTSPIYRTSNNRSPNRMGSVPRLYSSNTLPVQGSQKKDTVVWFFLYLVSLTSNNCDYLQPTACDRECSEMDHKLLWILTFWIIIDTWMLHMR